jgi:hypothetical protein
MAAHLLILRPIMVLEVVAVQMRWDQQQQALQVVMAVREPHL